MANGNVSPQAFFAETVTIREDMAVTQDAILVWAIAISLNSKVTLHALQR